MSGLVEIKRWLHVWTEAERAARLKKPHAEAQGEGRITPTGEDGEMERIRPLPHTHQVATRDE